MESTQKTYQEVSEFYHAATRYLEANAEDNKFRYALARTVKSAGRVMGDYQDKTEAINIKHCLAAEDGKGEILRDEHGQFKFTKDGQLKRNEERGKLWRSLVKIDVHYATELPKELSALDKDNFIGFVIREEKEKK